MLGTPFQGMHDTSLTLCIVLLSHQVQVFYDEVNEKRIELLQSDYILTMLTRTGETMVQTHSLKAFSFIYKHRRNTGRRRRFKHCKAVEN